MKTTVLVLAVVVGCALLASLILYLLGRAQPERHSSTVTFVVPKPRPAVWSALTDYAAMPRWWPAVKSVHFETSASGETLTWQVDKRGDQMAFRTQTEQPPQRLVREIVGDNLPFGGTWTYTLADEGPGTRVTVVEDGFIKPPLFRAIMRYFVGLDSTLKDFADHFVTYCSGTGEVAPLEAAPVKRG